MALNMILWSLLELSQTLNYLKIYDDLDIVHFNEGKYRVGIWHTINQDVFVLLDGVVW